MSLRRGHARAEMMADINVVSLIDVMMLLLVIFMITAPIMHGGIDVQLPSADAAQLDADKSGMVVTITRDSVYVDRQAFSFAAFRAGFRSLVATRGKKGVNIASDRNISVQRLFEVVEIIKTAGISDVGFMTVPVEGGGR